MLPQAQIDNFTLQTLHWLANNNKEFQKRICASNGIKDISRITIRGICLGSDADVVVNYSILTSSNKGIGISVPLEVCYEYFTW